MRLSRKEDAEAEAIKDDVVTKITATFILEEFTRHRWTGGLERITPQTENRSDIKLYISKNNLDYVEYEGEYTLTFKVTKEPYLDENGWVITEKAKCFEACIEGIEIGPEYQYMALATEDVTDRYIIPQSMIRIYNAKGEELPTTVGTSVRYGKGCVTRPEGYIWGAEEIMRGTEKSSLDYFKSWGFEFDFDGNGSNYDRAYYSSYVYGIARGNFDYAKGTYCEAYDEVREYWLYEIENLLALGYDQRDVEELLGLIHDGCESCRHLVPVADAHELLDGHVGLAVGCVDGCKDDDEPLAHGAEVFCEEALARDFLEGENR
jgi:hypothetical protein